ncbi:MAG: hypothetical protein QOI21_4584 [Actinomycetota bacterium]|jgi:hypothetical protein|nr:hypothetical protein [Actinomycetota bacterium]
MPWRTAGLSLVQLRPVPTQPFLPGFTSRARSAGGTTTHAADCRLGARFAAIVGPTLRG